MDFKEIQSKEKRVISFKVSEETIEKWHKLLEVTGTKASRTFEYIVDKLYEESGKREKVGGY